MREASSGCQRKRRVGESGERVAQVPLQSKWSILSFLQCVRGCPRRWWWLCRRQARRPPLWPRLSSTFLRKWGKKQKTKPNKALAVKKQTAGSPARLLEPKARSTSESIIDDAPYSCTERWQARICKYSEAPVFNLGFFIDSTVLASNTLSSKYLMQLPVFIRKSWKLFTLFSSAVFCRAELFG